MLCTAGFCTKGDTAYPVTAVPTTSFFFFLKNAVLQLITYDNFKA